MIMLHLLIWKSLGKKKPHVVGWRAIRGMFMGTQTAELTETPTYKFLPLMLLALALADLRITQVKLQAVITI